MLNKINENSKNLPDGYLEIMQRRRYSNRTIKSYSAYFIRLREFPVESRKQNTTGPVDEWKNISFRRDVIIRSGADNHGEALWGEDGLWMEPRTCPVGSIDFQESFSGKDPKNITSDMINQYILELIKFKRISFSQQNQRINAIKFYYEKVLGRPKQEYKIDRPKHEKKLPKVYLFEGLHGKHTLLKPRYIFTF